MNLRDALDPKHGAPVPDELEGREDHLWMNAFVAGWAQANDRHLVTSTPGPTMRIHDLDNHTRSMLIQRRKPITAHDLRVLVQARLDAIEYWEPESTEWGPDPWETGQDVRRSEP